VNPKAVCVLPGGTVKFTNGDTVAHDIESGAACTALNLGPIAAAAQATATMPTTGTCAFHDQDDPSSTAFQGTVAVTNAPVTGPGY
jgi:plastocyanin